MDYFDILKKNVVKRDDQGYALYFRFNNEEIEKVNGLRDINLKNKKIDFDTHFRLASVSKQFIACGIVKLVSEGLLSFDTCVLDIFDCLPDYFKNIKVINLLNHTSGIYDYEDWEHEEDAPQVLDYQIIDFLKTTDKTYFEVGSKYQYSNTAYVLLGLIIEKISKKTLGEYIENNVFKPAGMLSSYVNYQGITNIPDRAYGHIVDKDGNLYMKDQYWCSATIGDGGLYSSINDLKKWVDFYKSEKSAYLWPNIFSKQRRCDNLKEGEHNKYNEIYYYGMGMRTIVLENGKEIYYHCGETIGTNTLLLFSKDYDLVCLFLSNFSEVSGSTLKDNVLELIHTVLNNK